jgi:hypothetical protein
MLEAWNERDYARYFGRNHEIHDAIMAASRCGALQGAYQNLAGRVQRARYSARKTDEQWARAIDDHALMIILLRRRDGAGLGRLMREHIKSQMAVISAAYSAHETPRRQPFGAARRRSKTLERPRDLADLARIVGSAPAISVARRHRKHTAGANIGMFEGLPLGAQAIEKCLKAYLIFADSKRNVKAFQHSIPKLLSEAAALFPQLSLSKFAPLG